MQSVYTVVCAVLEQHLYSNIHLAKSKKMVLKTKSVSPLHAFLSLLILLKIYFLEKFFQENRLSIKQIGSRSGPTFCRA